MIKYLIQIINSNDIRVDVANRDDEFSLTNNNTQDSNEIKEELITYTRSGRIGRSYN